MPKKIYVGEDDPVQVKLYKAILEKQENCEITFFSDGLELYQKVQEDLPDLLALDIIMPSLSGLAVTRLLKIHDDYRKIPILVVSSVTEENIGSRAKAAGADIFLPKPIRMEELSRSVAELLR